MPVFMLLSIVVLAHESLRFRASSMIQERDWKAEWEESRWRRLSKQLLGRNADCKIGTSEDAMGREADCRCVWKESTAEVKALLETYELILRGGIRRKIPAAEMQGVHADGGRLRFVFQDEPVSLELDDAVAAKWAERLTKSAPGSREEVGDQTRIKSTCDWHGR